jgi:hypothetical protein
MENRQKLAEIRDVNLTGPLIFYYFQILGFEDDLHIRSHTVRLRLCRPSSCRRPRPLRRAQGLSGRRPGAAVIKLFTA